MDLEHTQWLQSLDSCQDLPYGWEYGQYLDMLPVSLGAKLFSMVIDCHVLLFMPVKWSV